MTLNALQRVVADRLAANLPTYLYTSWGYDQTQVDYYRVLGLTSTGKSARIQRVRARDVAAACNVHRSLVPTDEAAEGAPVLTVRLYGNHATADGQYAWIWDGRPKYATGHGYGH